MRLLAYGGIRFVERHRLGAWPFAKLQVFDDPYGLEPGRLSYGVGVLEGAAFLVVRELQNPENRGGYPFTLLLDPGAELWRRARWNPVRMLRSVLAADGPGRVLMTEPETVTEGSLAEWARRAAGAMGDVPGDVPSSEPMPLFATSGSTSASGAGAASSTRDATARPSRTSRPGPAANALPAVARVRFVDAALEEHPLHVAPAALGFPARPDLDSMDALLESLPPCFRCGRGWLVGCGSLHGRELGAVLVIDDGVADGAAPDHGGAQTLEIIGSDGTWSARLQDLLERPLWEWTEDPESVLADVERGGTLLGAPHPPRSLLEELERPGLSPLREDLRRLAFRRLTSAPGPFDAAATRFVAAFARETGLTLEPRDAERLDPEALYRLLVEHGRFDPSGFPPATRLALWLCHLERASSRWPELLEEALAHLAGAVPEPSIEKLVRTALVSSRRNGGRLESWWKISRHAGLDSLQRALERMVTEEIRTDPDLAVAYALFAGDPGGDRLASLLDTAAAEQAAERILRADLVVGREALDAWLAEAAGTRLRQRLSGNLKYAIAARIGGPWQGFLALSELLHEGRSARRPAPTKTEVALLKRELDEMLEVAAAPALRAPDIEGLERLLGGLSQEKRRKLKRLDPAAPARRSKRAIVARAGPAEPERSVFDRDGLAFEVTQRLLDWAWAPRDTRKALLAGLTRARRSAQERGQLSKLLRELENEHNLRLVQCLAEDHAVLQALLACLDERAALALMDAMAEQSPVPFEKLAVEAFRPSFGKGLKKVLTAAGVSDSDGVIEREIARYLLHRGGSPAAERIKREVFRGDVDAFRRRLAGLTRS